MEITEVRVRLCDRDSERCKAYCSITLEDEFVIRDLRIVEGTSGLFVAMPSRRATASCPRCAYKNHMNSKHCNECGSRLPPPPTMETGHRTKAHRDIAHPITPAFREVLQQTVLNAYRDECDRAQDPEYQPRSLEEESEAEAPVAEPVQEVEEPQEVSEYDELIADLRRRTGGIPAEREVLRKAPSREAPRSDSRRTPAPAPERRSAPLPQRRPTASSPRPAPSRSERPGSPSPRPGPRPAPTSRPPVRARPVEQPLEDRPALPVRREAPAFREMAPPPAPSRYEDAEEIVKPVPQRPAPMPPPVEAEDTPFGAGIL